MSTAATVRRGDRQGHRRSSRACAPRIFRDDGRMYAGVFVGGRNIKLRSAAWTAAVKDGDKSSHRAAHVRRLSGREQTQGRTGRALVRSARPVLVGRLDA